MTLIEVCLSLFLSILITSLSVRLLVSCQLYDTRQDKRTESTQMWRSICRVVSQDVHAAAKVTAPFGVLNVLLANGLRYKYVLNSSGQYVRVQSNGGTSVIAVGVESIDAQMVASTDVSLTAKFANGTQRTMDFSAFNSV